MYGYIKFLDLLGEIHIKTKNNGFAAFKKITWILFKCNYNSTHVYKYCLYYT